MNKLILSALCVLALVSATPGFADTVNGVLAEERVVNLPQDSGKWYVSVVGNVNSARYNEIVGWFSTNPSLKKLKDQVHFCQVTNDTAIYRERYVTNQGKYTITALPCVRVQRADAVVVYQVCGKSIPMTAGGLNGAIAGAVSETQGVRPILPWRRDMERRCGPNPDPNPDPKPDTDPDAQPLDDGDTPNMDNQPVESPVPWVWLSLLCFGGLVAGVACGYGRQLYRKVHPLVW